jgi:Ca2+-binding EF-hand superfamily protein
VLYILVKVVKRYQKDRYAHYLELASRRMDSMRLRSYSINKQEQLKRIKPQLDLIAGRLNKVVANQQDHTKSMESNGTSDSESGSKRLSVHVYTGGAITFDAKLLFDELDTSRDGILSYTELNVILELDHVQLMEFVRRMNKLGGVSPSCSVVSRRIFLRHFVCVLTESSNFRPSKEEAEQLFDEIAKQGTNKYGGVEPDKFYTSSISSFLSDTQINNLLFRLRMCQSESSTEATRPDSVRSLTELADGGRNKNKAIRRDVFVAQYPQLLMEIAIDPDPVPIYSMRSGGINPKLDNMEVDITFEDLSLTVALGDNSINVVEKVTGRLRAGTMVSTRIIGFVGDKIGFASHLTISCPLVQNRQL